MDSDESGKTLFGPYKLRPIHQELVRIASRVRDNPPGIALYDFRSRAALVATDYERALAWPLEKVNDGKAEVGAFRPKVAGPVRAVLPLQTFSHLPAKAKNFDFVDEGNREALPVTLRIERAGKRDVAVVEWQDSDRIKVRRTYGLLPAKEFPDVTAKWASRLPEKRPFGPGVVSLNPKALLEIAKALGSPEAVRLHIRAAEEAIYVDACNKASKYGAGAVLMPISAHPGDGYDPAQGGADPGGVESQAAA